MNKTLHLNLKRKWFDMIQSGIKKEEYRDLSEYWRIRLCKKNPIKQEEFKKFDTITFSNGYRKDRPQFEIKLIRIKIGSGKPQWGADEGKQYFILELGKIIKL